MLPTSQNSRTFLESWCVVIIVGIVGVTLVLALAAVLLGPAD